MLVIWAYRKYMANKLKFIILFVCVAPIAGVFVYLNHMGASNFEAKGIVVDAQWNTSNHQMSLFLIKGEHSTKKLHHQNVILKRGQIKVGDTFKKVKGSKICLINNIEIVCIK